MTLKTTTIIFLALFLVGCGVINISARAGKITIVEKEYFDEARNRIIPVAFYLPVKKGNMLVIFNHGYRGNSGSGKLDYSYLLNHLADNGYFVVSIQHELIADEPLAMDGDFMITRMSNWERGVENIKFVLNELKNEKQDIDFDNVILIGHSNGGDMIMLYSKKYPETISRAISLDNRRVPLPRTSNPKIYSVRSNDYEADKGVLPTDEEKSEYGITVDFTNINHGNMDDNATNAERITMIKLIEKYLNE